MIFIVLECLVWSTVKLLKWFPGLNHFCTQINKGHMMKAGGYSSQNVVFQLTTKNMRTTVWNNTAKIIHIKPYFKNSYRDGSVSERWVSDVIKINMYMYIDLDMHHPCQHPWCFLAIRPYCPLRLAGPLNCIQCIHRADVCKSLLFSPNWCVHV